VITFFIPQYNEVNGDPALLARLGLLAGSSRVDFVNVSADIRSVRGSVNDTSTVTSPDTAQTVAWGAISAWAGNTLNAPPIPGVGFTNTFNFEFSQYVNYTDVLVTIGMPSGTVIDPDTFELRMSCSLSDPVMPLTTINMSSPFMTLAPTPVADPAGGYKVLNRSIIATVDISAVIESTIGNQTHAPVSLDGATCSMSYDAVINRRSSDGSLLVHADSISQSHVVRATVCDPADISHMPGGTGFYSNCSSFRQASASSGVTFSLVVGTLEHDLYAVGDRVCFPCAPENLTPGLNATYSILYTLPFNSFSGKWIVTCCYYFCCYKLSWHPLPRWIHTAVSLSLSSYALRRSDYYGVAAIPNLRYRVAEWQQRRGFPHYFA